MPKIQIDQNLCKGCGLCKDACLKKCIELSKDFNAAGYHPAVFVAENGCTACGFCYQTCPDVCIEVYK
jgi:2-oxoglutarate ferredoxin oxidoreductase subunit delta